MNLPKTPGIPEIRFTVASAEETGDERKQADRRFVSLDQREAFRRLSLATIADVLQ